MSKYKINFKANDDWNFTRNFIELGYAPHIDTGEWIELIQIFDADSPGFSIVFDLDAQAVRKYTGWYNAQNDTFTKTRYSTFVKEELKLLDTNNWSLHPDFTKEMGQEVEEWYDE